MSKYVSRTCSLILAPTLASLLASGCMLANTGKHATEQSPSPELSLSANQPQADDPGLPKVDLTGDLLYKVLIGEIAAHRGDLHTASDELLQAATESRDYRLAQRATRIAMDAQEYDIALKAARLWVELRPDKSHPKEALALVMVEQGRIDDAEAQFAALMPDDPGKQSIEFHRIARLLGQLSNRDNALAVMKALVAQYKDDPDAHFAAAFLADRVKDDKLVMDSLDQALALRPGWEEAGVAKLGHMIQEKYPREQIDAFAKEFLKQAPDANRVRISYGRYLIDQEANTEALKEFQAALKYEPDNTTALMAAGLLSVEEKKYDAARKYLEHNLKLTPDNDQIRLYLGQIAEEQKHYKEAAKWYRAITDSDKTFTAKLHLANTVAQLQGVDAAIKQLDSVQASDEDEFVRLALTKELILRDAHDLQRAKSIMDDAVARYPENTDLLYARGLLAAQLDDISEHEKDMRAVLAEDPNNAQALNALGYTLADATDRIKEAYDLISKALSMRPDDPFILDSMGWVQYRMGNRKDAIEYLQKALAKRDDPEIAAHLGEVLWVVGEKDEARKIWAKAKKEDPDNDTLNETIERLTK